MNEYNSGVNKWKIAFMIATLIILVIGGFVAYKYYQASRINRDAEVSQQTLINVAFAIQENQALPIITNKSGELGLEWISLQEVCGAN